MKLLALAFVGAVFAAAPAAVGAQAQTPPQAAAPAAAANPNEIVCERQTVVGSRLAHKKICMTRSQWESARRDDRDAIEKVQTQRGMLSEPTGTPGG